MNLEISHKVVELINNENKYLLKSNFYDFKKVI